MNSHLVTFVNSLTEKFSQLSNHIWDNSFHLAVIKLNLSSKVTLEILLKIEFHKSISS